jgi:hypothetical protein
MADRHARTRRASACGRRIPIGTASEGTPGRRGRSSRR